MKLKKKFIIILLTTITLINSIIPLISNAYSMGDDIVLKGFRNSTISFEK